MMQGLLLITKPLSEMEPFPCLQMCKKFFLQVYHFSSVLFVSIPLRTIMIYGFSYLAVTTFDYVTSDRVTNVGMSAVVSKTT